MKGWNEANMYGKEKITKELVNACREERDFLNDIYNWAINGKVIETKSLVMQIIEITERANKAIAKAEGK